MAVQTDVDSNLEGDFLFLKDSIWKETVPSYLVVVLELVNV